MNINQIDFPYFTEVVFDKTNATGVAMVNRKTGRLIINLYKWHQLPLEHKVFVLLHEEGHVALNSKDEIAVDAYAFDRYKKTGLSLKKGVAALTKNLNTSNRVHRKRAWLQLQRALKFDKSNN